MHMRRHDVVIGAIDDLITMNLQVVNIGSGLLNFDGRYVLEIIFGEWYLKYDHVSVTRDLLNDSYEINVSVPIQIEIVDAELRIVESLLKFFKIF
jgi:hypothetical protein